MQEALYTSLTSDAHATEKKRPRLECGQACVTDTVVTAVTPLLNKMDVTAYVLLLCRLVRLLTSDAHATEKKRPRLECGQACVTDTVVTAVTPLLNKMDVGRIITKANRACPRGARQQQHP